MNIAIIEDEPLARKELKRTLLELEPSASFVAEWATISESILGLKSDLGIDLIFCDIQLADGLSFEIFRQVQTDIPLIFVTAFDEYAIDAFHMNSIDYLLKPYDENALLKALSKYKRLQKNFQVSSSIDIDAIQGLLEKQGNPKSYKKRFIVKVGDQYKQIDTLDIAYFVADGNSLSLVNKANRYFIIDLTLEEVVKKIDPSQFFRVNRSYLVNNTSISKIHKYFNHRLKLELAPVPSEDVLVSRARVNDFLEWLDQ